MSRTWRDAGPIGENIAPARCGEVGARGSHVGEQCFRARIKRGDGTRGVGDCHHESAVLAGVVSRSARPIPGSTWWIASCAGSSLTKPFVADSIIDDVLATGDSLALAVHEGTVLVLDVATLRERRPCDPCLAQTSRAPIPSSPPRTRSVPAGWLQRQAYDFAPSKYSCSSRGTRRDTGYRVR